MSRSVPDPRIETETLASGDITVQRVHGDVTAKMISAAIRDFYAGTPTPHVVWDFSRGGVGALSPADVQKLADLTRPMAPSRGGGRTAFVLSSATAGCSATCSRRTRRSRPPRSPTGPFPPWTPPWPGSGNRAGGAESPAPRPSQLAGTPRVS